MRKVLFVFSLILIFNCSSFQMLSENDFYFDDQEINGPAINVNEVGFSYFFDERGFQEEELHITNNSIINISPTQRIYTTIKMGTTCIDYHPYTVFEILNTGNKTLELLKTPKVQIVDNNFILYETPDESVTSNNKSRFIIKLLAEKPGFYESLVTICSNDPDDERFSFYIQGEVIEIPQSEISIKEIGYHVYPEYYGDLEETLNIENRNNLISNVTSSMEYDTVDLGSVNPGIPIYSVLEISNLGDSPLYLLNDPYIEIDNELFELYLSSDKAVQPDNSSRFIIKILTEQLGLHETLITINTNDPENKTYFFKLKIDVENF